MRSMVVLLCLVLVACIPLGGDPYTMRSAAEGAIEATSVARQLAAASTRGAMDAAAVEATRYAGELLAVEAQMRGTQAAVEYEQTAVAVQSTRSAADLQATAARATSQVIEMQATQASIVEYFGAMGTATAIVHDQSLSYRMRQQDYNRENAWKWFLILLAYILLIALAVFLSVAIITYGQLRQARAKDIVARIPRLLPDTPQLPPPTAEPAENESEDERALRFLHDAAGVVGWRSQQLPRYDRMRGWSAESWTEVTDGLQRTKVLLKVGGKGSYIKEPHLTIQNLHQAISSGEVTIPPSPRWG